ncbi:MAG TPA: DUF3427 domain-containing protein [Nitrospinaceae bacterium]|nr:DUF3427 domain-containing protein [Nitrospinaceae bacterium]
MSPFRDELSKSIETGFIDLSILSKEEYQPTLLLNNEEAGQKVLSHILGELNSCEEFRFSVAFLTKSGIAVLMNTFKELEERNINGKILVSQYLNFTQPHALRDLLKFNNLDSRIVTNRNFHAKGYLFKKEEQFNLIVGSSNLTASALSSNTELNIKITATPESKIIKEVIKEFDSEFSNSIRFDEKFISEYESVYKEIESRRSQVGVESIQNKSSVVIPNSMQREALKNLELQRMRGVDKSLLISATGTGKTFLSAFDVQASDAKKILFVVHRANITQKAMESYKRIFGDQKTMGLYSGKSREKEADFLFSTVQTINREEHLKQFSKDYFDYIIIDETHRAGAKTYQRILDHFSPKFILGMTATPERTDGYDIFSLFNHNIAYEIRLQKAMKEDLLCPFHYFGVTDIKVNGEVLESASDFNHLVSEERINKIDEKIKFYGTDDNTLRGLIFCSKVDECKAISEALNKIGYKTRALSGDDSEEERANAINDIESDDPNKKIDYIITVNIFNEGIDIPRLNQVIMVRPTQSAIIFVQQLGRGLRKAERKEYLTVIDFIGNYQNNYLIPIALYGDTSYNKDTIRKLMASGSSLIPGSSTINFDKISKARIFESIDSSNLKLKKDLVQDYQLLKFKTGRIPSMVDFLDYGSRDPSLYVEYSKSYYNFVADQEEEYESKLNPSQSKLLEFFSMHINDGMRVEESIILERLIQQGFISYDDVKAIIRKNYGYEANDKTILSAVNGLNLKFVTEREGGNGKTLSINEKYGLRIVSESENKITIDSMLKDALTSTIFTKFLKDNTEYALKTFGNKFSADKFQDGFILYQKYSRKDVFRILNWEQNPNPQTVGGYFKSKDESNIAIFINYHKEEDISASTDYKDSFIDNTTFTWMTKSNRTLEAPEVRVIREYNGLRIPLFIKKSNAEGKDFYYMGEMEPITNSFRQKNMSSGDPVVQIDFNLNKPVEESLCNYITHDN